MFCPKCGNEEEPDSTFCSSCGADLDATAGESRESAVQGAGTTQMQVQTPASSPSEPPAGGTVAGTTPKAGPTSPPGGGKNKVAVLLAALVALLVVALIVVVLIFTVFKSDDKTAVTTQTQPVSQRSTPETAPGTRPSTQPAATGLKQEQSAVLGLSLGCPEGWQFFDYTAEGWAEVKPAADPTACNLGITSDDNAPNVQTLDQIGAQEEKSARANNFTVEKSATATTVGGLPAVQLVESYTGEGGQKYKSMKAFVIKGNTIYRLEFVSKAEKYDQYAADAQKILDSIRFNG